MKPVQQRLGLLREQARTRQGGGLRFAVLGLFAGWTAFYGGRLRLRDDGHPVGGAGLARRLGGRLDRREGAPIGGGLRRALVNTACAVAERVVLRERERAAHREAVVGRGDLHGDGGGLLLGLLLVLGGLIDERGHGVAQAAEELRGPVPRSRVGQDGREDDLLDDDDGRLFLGGRGGLRRGEGHPGHELDLQRLGGGVDQPVDDRAGDRVFLEPVAGGSGRFGLLDDERRAGVGGLFAAGLLRRALPRMGRDQPQQEQA